MPPKKRTNESTIYKIFSYLNNSVRSMNNSKIFAGIMIILMNVASKFVNFRLSKTMESYLKHTFSRQILVFAMAWMGTRDIYAALGLTAVFTILSDYLFNEESRLCIVPHKHRILHKLIDTNEDGVVSDTEMAAAMAVLEKAKREKQRKKQKEAYKTFDFEKYI